MFRRVAVRSAQLSGRRLQSTVAVPGATQVEQSFIALPKEDQKKVITDLSEIMKQDWTKISMEDKRASPKSRTLTKEWQEESNRIAKEKKINPIHGISSEGYTGKGFVQSD
ncbi:cytochrome c oxidase [Coemansia aciculifera]|uniref:Cytochrome c oxidase n=1 Tax=Coemansia aciculifera TaxID=417176 RepID=A0ACC1MAL9_9FUNG|nr:cytochrome c oxidase [Coemansia aciculifera]